MSVQTSAFRMADRLTGGILAETMRSQHQEGASFEEIARRLFADHHIEVSGQTLRRWARQLGIGEAA